MTSEEFAAQISTAILGASFQVDVMCAQGSGWTFPIDLADISALCDQRLDLRYLVRGAPAGSEHEIDNSLRRIVGDAWQIRCSHPDSATANAIIIDRECALVMSIESLDPHVSMVTEPIRASQVAGRFQRLWDAATDADISHFCFEDDLYQLDETEESEVITFSAGAWDELIQRLAARPEDMRKLEPRKFEELISELLEREGYETELTRITRDGGIDILATLNSPMGSHLYLVECKRYAADRPVGVSLVRELFGVLKHQRASGALIATTSYFTPDAHKFREPVEYQLGLQDYESLANWLNRTAKLI